MRGARKTAPDVLGVAWTVLAAVVALEPALRAGASLGPFDLLTHFGGLTFNAGVHPQSAFKADQIEQFIPWTNLAWHQVHSGQLPVWNPYSVTGTPLAFNWQSAVFSLPVALSYLFPVHLAFTVIVLTKLAIAGTGAYVLCRVLGFGPLASAFGGTVFELSGPIIVHSGWPMVGVTAWAGWILAAALMLLKGAHPVRGTVLLAVTSALAVYGGHPESLVMVTLAVVIVIGVCLIVRALSGHEPLLRPVVLIVIGALCGAGLSAPLLLPGTQLAASSARRYGSGAQAFPLSHLPTVLTSGFQGNSLGTTAYVGVITVALVLAAARVAWRKPEVLGMLALVVVTALLTFSSVADQALRILPGGRAVDWDRAVMVLALTLAVLGATGLDALARSTTQKTAASWAGWAMVGAGVLLAAIALAGGPARADLLSVIGPAVEIAVGLAVVAASGWGRRGAQLLGAAAPPLRRYGGALLLATMTAVLAAPAAAFWSVSTSYFATPPGVAALQRAAGDKLVGFGSCTRRLASQRSSNREVGIRPDANVAYGVREMAVYDPTLPESYFRSWSATGGQPVPSGQAQYGVFCAQISTVAQALLYGVGFVLEPPGQSGPPGTVFSAHIGNEGLYRVPGSADATSIPAPAKGTALPLLATGTPVPVGHPDEATWRLSVDANTPQVVRLRLTAVPGWRATIDDHPLALRTWDRGTMLEARVPAGDHVIELHYWPRLFQIGLVLALCTAIGLTLLVAYALAKRRSPSKLVPAQRNGPEPAAIGADGRTQP